MKAMMLLVEPMIPALRRYARSLLKDTTAADDLVQDTLERTITRWHQRDPEGNARTWVFTILHNLAINRLRQITRRGRPVDIDDMDESLASQPPMQEERLLHADLLKALDRLPDEQRSVLLLISVEDLSYTEAAKVLGVPVGTVMSRLSRGRERLMRLMEGDAPIATRVPHLRRVK
ncbi:sigma-70 family RNA polymerase sigma factor [Lichenihabitans psoromatis]|uniref:sigma-70 family RNA polymerase sigma factor n=1 Tax=Lichenihabitans psoromatis TaxID=2528642 RepID=UPI001478CBB7|nr:sigma-70 family RNA polymerase sigma factor [Lichenihabitans psoromatis]